MVTTQLVVNWPAPERTAPLTAEPGDLVTQAAPASVDREDFISAMGAAVAGVTVVTTDGPAGRFGLTVSAVSSVSADPPLVLACIHRRSPAAAAVRANGVFSVNLLAICHRHLAESFSGNPSEGLRYDFASTEWRPEITGAPCLVDAISSFDCVVESAYDSGSHTIFIGQVAAVQQNPGRPLLYTARSYGFPCHWS